MNLAFRIALNFMRRKNSRWPTYTAFVSVLGVSVGVAAFLVVVTVLNSFENQLKNILLASNPNLIVYAVPNGIPNADQYVETLKKEIQKPIRMASPFIYNEGVLNHSGRTATVILRAIRGEQSANAEDLKSVVEPKGALQTLNDEASPLANGLALQKPKIILGKGLALKLGAKAGDEITLVSGGMGNDAENRSKPFEVAGIANVGIAQYDERLAFISYLDAVYLFGKPGTATGIEFKFENPDDALEVSRSLQDKIPHQVRAWQELDRGLFDQIERDGRSIKFVVFLIIFVAGFNIIATLSLGVADRARQIALLRSIGASRELIQRVFVVVGVILGVVGAIVGILLAVAVLKLFSGFELGELKTFYFLERIPVTYDFKLMGAAFGVALLLSFLSSLIPAHRATKVSPLYGLKHGHNT